MEVLPQTGTASSVYCSLLLACRDVSLSPRAIDANRGWHLPTNPGQRSAPDSCPQVSRANQYTDVRFVGVAAC